MGLEGFLAERNLDLASLLERVQARGGHSKQVYARRRCGFLAILTWLSGYLAGNTTGSARQRERRAQRIRRRREDLEAPNARPERGEQLLEWSTDEEEATPRQRRAAVPKERAFSPPASAAAAPSSTSSGVAAIPTEPAHLGLVAGVPVYSLDWPVEHSYDLRTFAEQLLRNVNISQSQSVSLVSLDQHKVLDAVDIAQARSIFSLLGDLHDAALLVCSYAPEGSGNRSKTYNFVQSVSRYTAQSVSLVHTSAKIFGPRAKAAFLDALFTEAGNILDPLPLTIWHFDDSGDIVQAIERLGNSRIRARQWDGSHSQRYSLLEHIRFELGVTLLPRDMVHKLLIQRYSALASRPLEVLGILLQHLSIYIKPINSSTLALTRYSPAHLTTFKERVEYMLNGMLESEWPSEETLFQFAYGRLKPYRGLARVIERIKESPKGSPKRSFSWIWSKLTEHLHELKEDQNEQSIREALLGKTTKPQEKATPAKPPAKAGAKATIPCKFYAQGNCNRGTACPFSHEAPKAGPPKAKPTAANTKANAAATVALVLPSSAKAHSPSKASTVKHGWFARAFRVLCSYFSCVSPELACPATVTSTVTVAANVMSGAPYFHEFIADSGAGRSLESRSSLIDQGIPGTEFSQKVRDDDKVVFSTGNGKVTSSKSLGFDGETFGSWKSYVLDSCPSVRSMGEIVELQGLPFVWIPGQMPAFLQPGTEVHFDESSAHFACRLEGFVPIFRDRVRFALPASQHASSSKDVPDGEVVAPGDTAFEPVPDDDAPAVDGPEDEEVIRDEFSGLLRAYVGKRTAENAARNLLQFVGAAASDTPNVLVKTDCDRSLTSAISQVGWAQEPSLQNRWPHNSQLERHIRTLEETTRASHLGAGFHLLQGLWPVSVAYAANALNIVKWKGETTFYELATGTPFGGPRLALGRLVHYRVHDASKREKFDASTLPGVFAGWKLDAASVYKGVVYVLDYNKLRSKAIGFEFPVAVPFEEVFVPDEETFPMRVAADRALAEFKEAALDEITALDIPFSEITCSREAIRKRNEYITLDRVIKFGPTPGCGACAFETKTHTPVCRARFNALVKADRISKPSKPPVPVADDDKSKDDGTAVPPATSERVEFEELFGDQLPENYAPKDTSLGNKEAVSEVPDDCLEYSPSEAEDEGSTHAAVILQIDDDFKQSNIDRNRCRRTSFVNQVLFEYPSSLDSQVGVVAEQSHITCVRLDRDLLDLSSQEDVDQLLGQVEALPGCDVWATMPDTHRCAAQGPKEKKPDASTKSKRAKQRHQEQKMLELALPVFQKCIDNFGRLSVEWPKGSELQNLPIWLEFEKKNVMRRVVCHGCMFGACGKHYPVKLPLVVSTNCIRTLETLSQYQCDQSHVHETVVVQTTSHSSKMAKAIIESYYPNKLHTFAPNHSHAFVTRNLSRKEWTANPKAVEAVKAEAAGLRNNETWDDSTARLLGDLKREARQTNRNVKIADILTLCGEKFSELPEEFRKFKGRVVYRGDKIYDELGNLVQFTDTATNPTAITALNVALWFACMPGNTASSSDAIQAFLQSVLPEETWVALPPELWLEEWHQRFKKGDRVVVRLRKSLYGHPLAGKLWEERLASKLRELGGKELQSYPSNWVFTRKGQVLLLCIYVDDLVLAGPTGLHDDFWKELGSLVKLDLPTFIEQQGLRIIGRHHSCVVCEQFTQMTFAMDSFAKQAVDFYCELTQTERKQLKPVPTPSLNEASFSDQDFEEQGHLHQDAAKILMKTLWLARLNRPDLSFIVARLATKISRWTRAGDKQLFRLMSYLCHTPSLNLVGRVGKQGEVSVAVYTDADFGACPVSAKSTSGVFLTINTGEYRFPILWYSKKQSSVARSTPEAEAISMASALFGETLNVQETVSLLLQQSIPAVFEQDNEALIKILKAGYSAKLRHMGRVHRINVASMAEVLAGDDISCRYCHTKDQIANGLTKVIVPCEWGHMLQQLCLEQGQPEHALVVVKPFIASAERFALQLPQRVSKQDLVQLLSYLPYGNADRADDKSRAHAFTVGAFSRGTRLAGVRSFTRQFPHTCRALCRYICSISPCHTFTTVTLSQGVRAPMHRDSWNRPGSVNLLCTLTPNSGSVWLHDAQGGDLDPLGWGLKGMYLTNPCVFDPRKWHCTTPCQSAKQDMRVVVVAFTVRDPDVLSSADAQYLRELGFHF
ncbi:RE1 [Symbiodinium sp. CCMP2592]|nr:RE1 [Symbiodinium sp. CCMP2592]